MTEALRSRYRSIHAGERLVFRTVVFRPRPAEGVLRRNGARFRDRSASMSGGSRRFRRARSFAASGPIRKQGREIQRYCLFGTLRGEACGERHRRASAGGGFDPRGAEAPQVILTFRLGIIELTLASALDFRTLASPKILRLGIIKPTLASALDFSYFGFAEDTPSRHNQANACFCTRLFVSLTALRRDGAYEDSKPTS